MKNKGIGRKILPLLIAGAIVIVAGYMYVDMNGNPFDAPKLNKQSDVYMQENYPDVWENVYRSADAYFVNSDIVQWDENCENYTIHNGTWQVYYTDKDDELAYMYLVYDRDCNLIYDSCGDRYLKGATIYEKLEQEYRNYVANVFNEVYNYGIPNRTISMQNILESDYATGTFENSTTTISHISEYTGPVLDINKSYTMEELAKEYGTVFFRYKDGITQMEGAEYSDAVDSIYDRCLEVRDIVEKYDIPFWKISILQGNNEGVFRINHNQLFDENLHQYIQENYTVGQ